MRRGSSYEGRPPGRATPTGRQQRLIADTSALYSPSVFIYSIAMAIGTQIEWTDATWNPISGCSKISRGCDFCYAERIAERFRGTVGHPFQNGFDLTLRSNKL